MLNEVRRKLEKPRVRWNPHVVAWYCTDAEGRSAYSHSPLTAYRRYLSWHHGIPYVPPTPPTRA